MIQTKKLDCGVRLVYEQIPYVKSASVGIWVKAGASDETAENSGISHLIEHMMFKGTKKRSAKDIAFDIDRLGAHINAFTGKEATCYYVKTISSSFEKAAEILLDMFLNSEFDTDELKKEKQVIYEEMKMIQDTPDEDAHDILMETLFCGDPLGKSIIGTEETVGGISRDDIKGYISKKYARDSIVVSIAGSFDEKMAEEIFNRAFQDLSEKKESLNEKIIPYTPAFRVKAKDIEQSHICMARRAVKLDDDEYFAWTLLNNAFGGTMSSRLFQNIREEKGLAYSVYSSFAGYENEGLFEIYAGVSHDKVKDASEAIRFELLKLLSEGITEDELEMARQQVKSMYAFEQESVNARMFKAGKNMIIAGKIYSIDEAVESFDAVTMNDIRRVSEKVADIKEYSAVSVSNREFDIEKYIRG